MTSPRWRRFLRWLPVAGTGAELVGALLPWLVSGRVERNSFGLVGVASRLDILDATWERVVASAWYLLPAALLVCASATVAGRLRLAAVVALLTAVDGVVLVLAVDDVPFPTGLGRDVTLWASLVTIVSAATSAGLEQAGRRRDHP